MRLNLRKFIQIHLKRRSTDRFGFGNSIDLCCAQLKLDTRARSSDDMAALE